MPVQSDTGEPPDMDRGMIPRHLAARVREALKTSRVVNIVGPRQAGKSTLVEHQIPIAHYLTLDDDLLREAMRTDPYSVLSDMAERHRGSGLPIAIDEVQRLPEITLALKRIVDRNRAPGQFLLTGSADIFTAPRAIDSLAGRVMSLTLRPLSAAEVMAARPCRLLDAVAAGPDDPRSALPEPPAFTRAQAMDMIARGGFPEVRPLADRDRLPRYRSYLDSILEKDVPSLAAVRKPDSLRRFILQLGARTGQELKITTLCDAVGVSWPTLSAWFDLLTALGLVHRLPAWNSGRMRRDIRAPKIHFMDTGCATAIRNETAASFAPEAGADALGPILESFVFVELEKTLPLLETVWDLYHWRSEGQEIDIVAEAPGRVLALFEVKASTRIQFGDFGNIDRFWAGPGRNCHGTGFIVYLGEHLLSFGPRKIALPLSMLWAY